MSLPSLPGDLLRVHNSTAGDLYRWRTCGAFLKRSQFAARSARNPIWIAALVLLFATALMPTVANCQAVYGIVFGAVLDPSGAAVAGAEITVTSLQKGSFRLKTVSQSGRPDPFLQGLFNGELKFANSV